MLEVFGIGCLVVVLFFLRSLERNSLLAVLLLESYFSLLSSKHVMR